MNELDLLLKYNDIDLAFTNKFFYSILRKLKRERLIY
jgi:hypothetical protein